MISKLLTIEDFQCPCALFLAFHAIAHGKFRFVFPRRGKAEELSEPRVVEIAGGRVAVRLDPFGVLDPK